MFEKLVSSLPRIVSLAVGVMNAVEAIMGAVKGKSAEKKEAYIDGLMAALGVSEAALGRDIFNDSKFKELLGNLADSVIAINNFIRDYKEKNGDL